MNAQGNEAVSKGANGRMNHSNSHWTLGEGEKTIKIHEK
jgi:hypothetical protein